MAGLERPVDLELGSEFGGELRKAPQVFVQFGRFAVFLAKDDFAVNQVQQLVVVEDRRRKLLEERLDRQAVVRRASAGDDFEPAGMEAWREPIGASSCRQSR